MDGARLIVATGMLAWNATALRLVKTSPGVFDDSPDHAQTYWGAGVVGPNPLWNGAKFSLHYHGIDRKNAVFEKGNGRAIRHTLGLRAWKTEGAWDFNYEGFAQWGSFRGMPIRAWALSEDTGYGALWTRMSGNTLIIC
jgi:Alginate export